MKTLTQVGFLVGILFLTVFLEIGRKIQDTGVHVYIQSQPDWCPPCRKYEPEIKKAFSNRALRGVGLTVAAHIDGGPDFIPYTLIKSLAPECVFAIDGYVNAETLTKNILDVIECQKRSKIK